MLVTLKILGQLLILMLALAVMLAAAPFVAIGLAAVYVAFLVISSLYETVSKLGG